MAEFGHFEVEGVLGSGGMGKVYRAKNTKTGKIIALKLMQREMLRSEEFRKRFEKEADLNMRLEHPNIVRVYDYGIIAKRPYIEMELLPNGSLDDLFKTPRKFRLSRSAELLQQVAAGLDFAHSHDIIHRDIKLENILLGHNNEPKLVDFGLARAIQETHLTKTATMLGTPLYMSPEQANSTRNIDYRSDLYSLGVMGYLLATGHYPFYDDSLLVVLNQHLSMVPPTPTEVNPGLPPMLDAVLIKALAKDPAERFDSAAAFADAYGLAIRARSSHVTLIQKNAYNPGTMVQSASGPNQTLPTPAPAPPQQQSNQWLWTALSAVAAIVVIGGLAGFALNGRGTTELIPDETPPAAAVAAEVTETPIEEASGNVNTAGNRPTLPPEWTVAPPSPTSEPAPALANNTIYDDDDEDGEAYSTVLMETDLYDLPKGIILRTIPRGTELEAIGRNIDGGWIQVYNDDDLNLSGWVRVEALTPFEEETLASLPNNAPRPTPLAPLPTVSGGQNGPSDGPGGANGPGDGSGPPRPGGLSFPQPIPGGRDWASTLCSPLPGFEITAHAITLRTVDWVEYDPNIGDWLKQGEFAPNTELMLRNGPLCIDGITHWRILAVESQTGGWVAETADGEPVLERTP
jgi:serine/threonine protein kinase